MLFLLLVCLLVISIECLNVPEVELNPKDKVVVKLDPDQVVDAFKSVVSSDYLRGLAHNLALSAAEQFLVMMKEKEQSETMSVDFRRPEINRLTKLTNEAVPPARNAASTKEEVVQEIERWCGPAHDCSAYLYHTIVPHNNPIAPDLNIDVKQAMTLLRDPAPDGDNLDLISPNLSEDEEANKTKPPVINLMKVNGKYVRRLLRFI